MRSRAESISTEKCSQSSSSSWNSNGYGISDGRHPRLGDRLEAADHQPAHLLLEVGVAVGVPQDRQVGVQPVDLVGDDVEVLGGVQRDGDADLVAQRLGPLAGAVDDHLGLDVAAVGAHPGDPPAAGRLDHVDAGHPDVLDDARRLPSVRPWRGPSSGRWGWRGRRRGARSRRGGRRPASAATAPGASAGVSIAHSRSKAAAVAAVRRSWVIRSSVRATMTPPHWR